MKQGGCVSSASTDKKLEAASKNPDILRSEVGAAAAEGIEDVGFTWFSQQQVPRTGAKSLV